MIRRNAAVMLLSMAVFTGIPAGPARADEEPAELAQARTSYQKEVESATRPLRDRHVQALERIKKSLTLKGNLAGALKVQEEMDSLGLGAGLARLAGDWVLKYANGTVHHLTIDPNGSVFLMDTAAKQELKTSVRGRDFIFDYPSPYEIIERVVARGDELQVEHFTPKTTYPQGTPATRGSGKRVARKK
jgi:hypothetical protein